MAQLDFTVDAAKCTHCRACVADCPSQIIEMEGKSLPRIRAGQEGDCLECQHCLAVCPTGAISIFGLDPDDSLPLTPAALPSLDQQIRLLRGRRSVRQYRPGNVRPDLLAGILAAVANSPTGCNRRGLTFTLVDDEAAAKRLLVKVVEAIEKAQAAGRIPEAMSFLNDAAVEYRKSGQDDVFRGAPHVLIVSAPADAVCPTEDVAIAVSYFEILAQSAGLGTVWCGYLKFALDTIPELKDAIGLPRDRAFYPIVFGHPAVRYARTVQRDSSATVDRMKV